MKQIFLFITLVLLVIKYFSQQLDTTARFVAENLFLKVKNKKVAPGICSWHRRRG